MPSVSKLVAMLKSPSTSKRYHACEELRVMPTIPDNAKEALQGALKDPDPLVADAATLALHVHTGLPIPPTYPTATPTSTSPTDRDYGTVVLVGILVAQVPPMFVCLPSQTCLSWYRHSIVTFTLFSLISLIPAILITRLGGLPAGLTTAVVLGLLMGLFSVFAGAMSAIW